MRSESVNDLFRNLDSDIADCLFQTAGWSVAWWIILGLFRNTAGIALCLAGVLVFGERHAQADGVSFSACDGVARTAASAPGTEVAFADVLVGSTITVALTTPASGTTLEVVLTKPNLSQETKTENPPANTLVTITFVIDQAGNQTINGSLTGVGGPDGSWSVTCTPASQSNLESRLSSIFSVEPDRNRLRRRLNGETPTDDVQPLAFSAQQSDGFLSGRFSTSLSQISAFAAQDGAGNSGPYAAVRDSSGRTDVWVEAYLRRYWSDASQGDQDGTLGILYGGIDYTLSDDILIGFLAQFDWLDETTGATGSELEGFGWMAGPYATFRLADAVFLDVRAAWGQSYNDQRLGTATGSFDTTRWVVAAQLSGDWHHDAWRVTPVASIRYGREEADAYILSSGTAIASNTGTVGSASAGPEIGYTYVLDDGTHVEPFAALFGIWNFAGADSVTLGAITNNLDHIRAEAELGVSTRWQGGASLRASLAYDGLGTDDFDAVSGRLWLSIPLN